MSLFRSCKDLREQYDALSEYVRTSGEPLFLSDEQGRADMVLLSMEQYEALMQKDAFRTLLSGVDLNEKHPCVDVLAELDKLSEEEENEIN